MSTQQSLFDQPPKRRAKVSGITLRDYQQDACDAVYDEFQSVRSTLVVLPTGCGKSVVFSAVMARYIEQALLMSGDNT